ncbi:hypothetical protein HRbin02_01414 [Candidatus Calditenuaceae archaeon HR02]|nr:hypothetical protein HRbin02_01414 [Candidatus Calditenuaceae archaeon HR02]
MSEVREQGEPAKRGQELEEPTRRYRDVAVLLAAASAMTGSPSLIDRMTYALGPEPAMKAVADALRIVQSDLSSQRPAISQGASEKGYPEVRVRDEAGNTSVVIPGRLPGSETVRNFLEEVSRDVSIARKIGTYASSLLVGALIKAEGGG